MCRPAGRSDRVTFLRAVLLGGGVLVVLVLLVGFAFSRVLGGGRDVDCSRVALPTAAAWTAAPRDEQHRLAGDLELCSRYDGLTEPELAAAFGPPTGQGRTGDGTRLVQYDLPNGTSSTGATLPADRLSLYLGEDGRVEDTNIEYATTGGGPIR